MRNLTGSLFIKGLVFGWLENPDASLEQLARLITENGAPISAQGVDQRFTREAAELAKGVLEEVMLRAIQVAGRAPIELLNRFNGVYLTDCSLLTLPNVFASQWPGTGQEGKAGQAQLKVETTFELNEGGLTGLNLLPGRTHDGRGPLANAAFEPNSLRIQDLGYWNLTRMAAQDRRGEFWLSRYKHGTCLWSEAGVALDLARWLTGLEQQDIAQAERTVVLGASGLLKARLIAQRMPQEIAGRRRAALKQRRAKQGGRASKAQLILCDWTLLVTNAPQEMLSIDEALVLYGARWQIELLFKLWKSHTKLGQSRSLHPWRQLCEIYCKLVGVVIQHWISVVGTWSNPRRSLVKAAQVVGEHARMIVLALSGNGSLLNALRLATAAMRTGCSQNPRRTRPNTYLTLLLYLLPWGLN